MPWTFPNSVIDVSASLTKDDTWRNLDIITAGSLSSGTKTVWLRLRMTGSSAYVAMASGSITADPSTRSLSQYNPNYFLLGIDSNGYVRYKIPNVTIYMEIIGYSDEEMTIPDGTQTSYVGMASTAGSYQDVTFYGSGMAFAVSLVQNWSNVADYNIGLRNDGAADDVFKKVYRQKQNTFFCPVTSSVGEVNRENASLSIGQVGWLSASGWTVLAAPAVKTFGSTGWQDVDLSGDIPAGALVVVLDTYNDDAGSQYFNLRPNGSTENISAGCYLFAGTRQHSLMAVDSNRILEAYIGDTDIVMRVLGYYQEASVEVSVNAMAFAVDFIPMITETIDGGGGRHKSYLEIEV